MSFIAERDENFETWNYILGDIYIKPEKFDGIYNNGEYGLSIAVNRYYYLFDTPWIRFLANNCFVIADITIEVEAESPIGVEKVEFYIDNQLVNTSYTPYQGKYSWNWDERAMFYHEIKVIAYDIHDKMVESEVGVTIFNYGIIP